MLTALPRAFRDHGMVGGATYLVARLLDRMSAGRLRLVRYLFVAQPVPAERLTRPPRADSVRLFEAQPGDPLVGSAPRPPKVLEQRFRDGARCFVAAKGNELAGFIWIKERAYLEDEVRCLYRIDAAASAAWDFDVFVQERYRTSRLFAQLWDFANAFLRERGYRWTLSRISAFNRDSLAAHRRLGGRVIGSAVFLVVGRFQWAFLSSRPYLHFSRRPDQYPTVLLTAPVSASEAG
jgi:hypothetical protein